VVGDLLRERRLVIAVAESCTGGLLASRLTDVPGSSEYVERGVVCYSKPFKGRTARRAGSADPGNGAVSEAVARAMARAWCPRLGWRRDWSDRHRRTDRRTPENPWGPLHRVAIERDTQVRTFRFVGRARDGEIPSQSAR